MQPDVQLPPPLEGSAKPTVVSAPKPPPDEAGYLTTDDKSIPLYCYHSPRRSWREDLRRLLFPRTFSAMEVFEGRPPLNKEKTLMVDWLDYVVLLLVAITIVMLCLQDPMAPSSSMNASIDMTNDVLAFLFLTENIIRILCFGFIYFKADYWNILDTLIVLLSVGSALVDLAQSGRQNGLEALRILILFRPLRSIRFIDTARITMVASLRAFKSIGDVVLLLVMFLLLIATSGVTQYNSRLRYRCFNDDAWNSTINVTNPDLQPWWPGNYTRFQAYDLRQITKLRAEVEFKQCGYRYGKSYLDRTTRQNITSCRYSQACAATLRINKTIPFLKLGPATPAVNTSLSIVESEVAANTTACLYYDGSVSCSIVLCPANASVLRYRYAVIQYDSNGTPLSNQSVMYLTAAELRAVCNQRANETMVTTICINLNDATNMGLTTVNSFDRSPTFEIPATSQPSMYCGRMVSPTDVNLTVLNQGSVNSIYVPFDQLTNVWPYSSNGSVQTLLTGNVSSTTVLQWANVTVPFPGTENFCAYSVATLSPYRSALVAPWRRRNVSWDCEALNRSATDSNLCCTNAANSTSPNGTAIRWACCVQPNSTSLREYKSQQVVCCGARTSSIASTTVVTLSSNTSTNGVNITTANRSVSLFSLVSNATLNFTVCRSLAFQELRALNLVMDYKYRNIQSTSSAETQFYSKQTSRWSTSVDFVRLQELFVSGCASALSDASIPLDQTLLNASTSYNIISINVVANSSDYTVQDVVNRSIASMSFRAPSNNNISSTGLNRLSSVSLANVFAYPPISIDVGTAPQFRLLGGGAVSQSTPTCAVEVECSTAPVDTAESRFNCDGVTWDNQLFAPIPPYGEDFRGLERRAMGPMDWEVVAWNERNCDASTSLLLSGYKCPAGYTCYAYKNPYNSKLGFDNLVKAMLTDFTAITLQTWYDLMYRAMDAVDATAALYFLAVTIIGTFFIVNLMVVLMTVEFDSCVTEEHFRLRQLKAARKKLKQEEKQQRRKQRIAERTAALKALIGNETAVFSDDTLTTRSDALSLIRGDEGKLSMLTGYIDGKFSNSLGDRGSDAFSLSGSGPVEAANPISPRLSEHQLQQLEDYDKHSSDDDDDDEANEQVLEKFGTFLRKQLDDRGASGPKPRQKKRPSIDGFSLDGSNTGSEHPNQQANLDGVIEAMDEDDDDDEGPNERGGTVSRRTTSLQRLRRNMRRLLHGQKGLLLINLLIFLNIVVLGTAYYGMSARMEWILNQLNFAFVIIFTIELLYRLFCVDIWDFVRSSMSLLDLVIVVVSWLDYFIPQIQVPIVRGIRVIRLLKVFKPFPNVYKWIKIIVSSLKSSIVLFLMTSFAVFVFAVFGMSLFGGRFCDYANASVTRPDNTIPECGNRPRNNYDTLIQAMITSFVITTGDDWHLVMVNGMRARGDFLSLFFIANYVIGNMILMNLLIGLLLSVRTETDEADRLRSAKEKTMLDVATAENNEAYFEKRREKDEKNKAQAYFAMLLAGRDEDKPEGSAGQEYAEYELRLQKFIESKPFKITVLAFIILNTLAIGLQSPVRAPDTPPEIILNVVDIATNVFFIVELILNFVAYGMILRRTSYLRRDSWNVFDAFLILVFVVIQFTRIVTKSQGKAQFVLSAVSSLRSMRPLRFVSQSKGMRLVIRSLVDSIAPLSNLLVVIMIVMTLYGIMGVQIFAGQFYMCNGTDPLVSYNTLDRLACEAIGGSWTNAPLNFDNLGQALLTLFVMSTTEGWSNIMYNGMDATADFNTAPLVNIQRKNCVYFISFVVVGSIFFVNLFVSIIIDAFQKAQQEDPTSIGSNFLTRQQNAWIRSQHTLLSHVAIIDYDSVVGVDKSSSTRMSTVRKLVRSITRHPLFDVFIYCCIFINFLVMAIEEYPQSPSMTLFGSVTNIFFTSIFVTEVVLRSISESPKRYIASRWNRFDLVVVALSLVALVFELLFASATFVTSFRSMRTIRLLRLLRKSRILQAVLRKFLVALYSLTNIGGILFLLIFCYGLVGMKLFGRVVRDGVITHRANFENIFTAFLMMLRVATGGNWSDVLNSCNQTEFNGYCLVRLGNCGISIGSQLFFTTFMIATNFVLLNVFVAVILDIFTRMTGESEMLTGWEASQFMKLWFHFDPERTYRMESRFLLTFLRHIPHSCVIGMGAIPSRRRLQHEFVFVESLGLDEYDGKIELQDLINALCSRGFRRPHNLLGKPMTGGADSIAEDDEMVVTKDLPLNAQRTLKDKMDRHFRRQQRDRFKPTNARVFPVAHRVAVQIIEAHYIRRKEIRRYFASIRAANMKRRQEIENHRALVETFHASKLDKSMASAGLPKVTPTATRLPISSDSVSLREAMEAQGSVWESRQVADFDEFHAAGYRSVAPPTAGVISAFRVLDAMNREEVAPNSTNQGSPLTKSVIGPQGGSMFAKEIDKRRFDQNNERRQQNILDVIASDEHSVEEMKRQGLHSPIVNESFAERLVRRANDPLVKAWSQEDTVAIANLLKTQQQLTQRQRERDQWVAERSLPMERQRRMLIEEEETEARQLLKWVEVQGMAQASVWTAQVTGRSYNTRQLQ